MAKRSYLGTAKPTKLESVDYDVAPNEAALATEVWQQGDERLLPDGYIWKKNPDGHVPPYEPDTDKPRIYPNEAARLARTGFSLNASEEFRVGSVAWYAGLDPTDPAQDVAAASTSTAVWQALTIAAPAQAAFALPVAHLNPAGATLEWNGQTLRNPEDFTLAGAVLTIVNPFIFTNIETTDDLRIL